MICSPPTHPTPNLISSILPLFVPLNLFSSIHLKAMSSSVLEVPRLVETGCSKGSLVQDVVVLVGGDAAGLDCAGAGGVECGWARLLEVQPTSHGELGNSGSAGRGMRWRCLRAWDGGYNPQYRSSSSIPEIAWVSGQRLLASRLFSPRASRNVNNMGRRE